MPQISKCRIVNFWYNDGKRLIADELYDFSELNSGKSQNVYIDMENGIGKTVLLQLMLQPVIPRAKIAERKIEDFFNRSGYHSYILLEWHLDNSKEKLLTGISIASSDSMEQDTEQSRGKSIKYYTFVTSYKGHDKFSIESLELSRPEKGRFVAQGYDYVRNLAKNNKGKNLQYYTQDDSKDWKNKLAQYGIVQNEWKSIMETLNQKEGGISSFFENYKKSDQIIDNLLIPVIEGKFGEPRKKEDDNTLETMLIQYAGQYKNRQSVLEEKNVSEKLAKDLKSFGEQLDNLWNDNDRFETSKSKYYAFYLKLRERIYELTALLASYDEEEKLIQGKMHDIKVEEQSAKYYAAVDEKARLESLIDEEEKKRSATEKVKQEARKFQQIMECASLHQEIMNADASLKALQIQLRSIQEESDTSHELKVLRNSISVQLNEAIPKCEGQIALLEESLETCGQELKTAQRESQELTKESGKAHEKLSQLRGKQEVYKGNVDNLVEELKINASRLMFGSYPKTDLDHAKAEKEAELAELRKAEDDKVVRKTSIQKRNDEIPNELATITIAINDKERVREKFDEDLEKYLTESKEIDLICQQYSMSNDSRYNGALAAYLKDQLLACQKIIRAMEQQKTLLEQQKQAVKNGTLHIPKEITDYLDDVGVVYQSCEKYLLNQVNNKKITREKCAILLEAIPSLAFAILVTDRSRFINEVKGEWLPAAVPVYTYGELTEVLEGQFPEEKLMALYSEEYFENPTDYLDRIGEEIQDYTKKLEETGIESRGAEHNLEKVENFRYQSDWETNQLGLIEQIDSEINEKQKELDRLDKERNSLNDELKALEENIREIQEQISEIDSWMKEYNKLLTALKNESDNQNEIDKQEAIAKDLDELLSSISKKVEAISDQMQKIKADVTEENSKLDEMNKAVGVIGVSFGQRETNKENDSSICKDNQLLTQLLTDPWKELLAQFQALMKMQGEQTDSLLEEIQSKQEEKSDKESRLRDESSGLEEMDYLGVSFNAPKKKEAREKESEADKKLKNIQMLLENLKECLGAEESLIKQTENEVKKLNAIFVAREEIGSDFNRRLGELNTKLQENFSKKKASETVQQKFTRIFYRTEDLIGKENIGQAIPEIVLSEQIIEQQSKELQDQYNVTKKQLEKADKQMHSALDNLVSQYKNSYEHFQEFFRNLQMIANNEGKGDRYYSMIEQVSSGTASIEKRIHQIATDLEDFERSKIDLIEHCKIQAKKIFDGLRKLERNSLIQLFEGKKKTQMFRFPSLPKEIDESIAKRSIEYEIDQCVQSLVKLLEESETDERILRRQAKRTVGSPNLLRKYIQTEQIRMEAYKVDKNEENGRHRSWEDTQIQNSGAQKFLVYFSIIVAIIAFNRSEESVLQNKEMTSVLILDNPFGPITSPYALGPMFKLAKDLNVQMICLSNISKCDITVCFDKVIKVVLKTLPLSSVEMLSHDENEMVEHGFYSSEQLTLDLLY